MNSIASRMYVCECVHSNRISWNAWRDVPEKRYRKKWRRTKDRGKKEGEKKKQENSISYLRRPKVKYAHSRRSIKYTYTHIYIYIYVYISRLYVYISLFSCPLLTLRFAFDPLPFSLRCRSSRFLTFFRFDLPFKRTSLRPGASYSFSEHMLFAHTNLPFLQLAFCVHHSRFAFFKGSTRLSLSLITLLSLDTPCEGGHLGAGKGRGCRRQRAPPIPPHVAPTLDDRYFLFLSLFPYSPPFPLAYSQLRRFFAGPERHRSPNKPNCSFLLRLHYARFISLAIYNFSHEYWFVSVSCFLRRARSSRSRSRRRSVLVLSRNAGEPSPTTIDRFITLRPDSACNVMPVVRYFSSETSAFRLCEGKTYARGTRCSRCRGFAEALLGRPHRSPGSTHPSTHTRARARARTHTNIHMRTTSTTIINNNSLQ